MAASHNLPQFPDSDKSHISKSGVLTLHGFGIRVRMQAGHLEIEDGVGPDRRKIRLSRVGHRLKRLVCIGEDGFVTLSALKWLSDVGASFAMLDRIGKVRVVTGPTSASETRLRRAQALALGNGQAVAISRELIATKLTGQENLVRDKLREPDSANVIADLLHRLPKAESIEAIRSLEAQAAAKYWNAWCYLPVVFPRSDVGRVPSHWLRFGTRQSPLTGSPRLSVNPANSLLNYTNALAESECRLAASACGLDPGIGFLHTDTANRDSLALDLIETIRPAIEAWLLDWLMREPLRRADFIEGSDGNCRVSSRLCSKLSETAATWGKLVAPWAEYVVHSLLASRGSEVKSVRGFKTPLTQNHRREAKGALSRQLKLPKAEHSCRGCGQIISTGNNHCANCAVEVSREKMREIAKQGRVASKTIESRSRLAETQRRQAIARWRWQPSNQPDWLTDETYSDQILPRLLNVTLPEIASALAVSIPYASDIRRGRRRPHPRHWKTLAQLVGVSAISHSWADIMSYAQR